MIWSPAYFLTHRYNEPEGMSGVPAVDFQPQAPSSDPPADKAASVSASQPEGAGTLLSLPSKNINKLCSRGDRSIQQSAGRGVPQL